MAGPRDGEEEAPAGVAMARPARQPNPAPASQPYDPDAPNSSGTRRSLFPPLWQRFKDQLADPSAVPPPSGAHVTLSDLEKLAELREAADPVYLPRPGPLPRQGTVSGWVGTPDPSKFVPGTNTLSVSEVEEEVSKGNIVMLDDWVKEISRLELWEKKMLFQSMLTDWMQNRFFVRTEAGAKVSFWDLYNYVYHNPELAALAKNTHAVVPALGDDAASASGSVGGAVPPGYVAPGLYSDPGPGAWRVLDQEAAKQMPWGLAGTGQLWRRRPTRWLWGVDGQMDAEFAMYVHEDKAHELLGPKYAGRDPRDVVCDERYRADIMRAGPSMGMAFMLTAARDVPVVDVTDAMVSRLARRMERRYASAAPERPLGPPAGAEPTPSTLPARYSSALGALFDVYSMMEPARLAQQTQLLDPSGRNVRLGSSLLLCTGPGGKVMLQAMSPGLARDRKAYVLGAVQDPELCESLVEEFLGDGAPDAAFASQVPTSMLMFTNGFKTGNTNNSPLMRREGEGPAYSTELIPARCTVFRLPRIGAASASERTAPLLLNGVRERQLVGAISDLYQRAYGAAMAAVPFIADAPECEAAASARRDAAAAVLQQGLAGLGLTVQGLGADEEASLAKQLFTDAEPLDSDELAMAIDAMGSGGDSHKLTKGSFATSSCSR